MPGTAVKNFRTCRREYSTTTQFYQTAMSKAMKQNALTLDLKDDQKLIEEYKLHHQRVWPQVIESLKRTGVLDMKIYCFGNRLFMLMTTVDDYDPAKAYQQYLDLDPVCQEWETLMDRYQQRLPNAPDEQKWQFMDCCFDMTQY